MLQNINNPLIHSSLSMLAQLSLPSPSLTPGLIRVVIVSNRYTFLWWAEMGQWKEKRNAYFRNQNIKYLVLEERFDT